MELNRMNQTAKHESIHLLTNQRTHLLRLKQTMVSETDIKCTELERPQLINLMLPHRNILDRFIAITLSLLFREYRSDNLK